MPVTIQTATAPEPRIHDDILEIGLLNNLSDAGLEGGERQFIDRLSCAAGSRHVRLRFFSLPDIPRGSTAKARLDAIYTPFKDLFETSLDGLIVTGCEPQTARLRDEPFWDHLTAVVDWAQRRTRSTIWSCLAAHAAVLHLDGIERRPLPGKLSGLYDVETATSNALFEGAHPRLRVPHSRYNDVAERDLVAAGYTILTHASDVGVDAFVREDRSLFVFLQGHPEYDADALFREYRRDVLRFLDGTRDLYPSVPTNYVEPGLNAALEAFSVQARRQRDPELFAAFPSRARQTVQTWTDDYASTIFGNWLNGLHVTTAEHAA